MSDKMRVGVIGCGVIAQIMHIPYILEYEQFELIAIADSFQAVLDDVGDYYNVKERHTDWRDLIKRDDIDAVVIAHSGSHYDTVMTAIDAGKHVLVEKPLSWNIRETQEIADRATKSGVTVQLGYHKLYDPAFEYAKAQVEQIQDLTYVRVTLLHGADEFNRAPYRVRRGNNTIEHNRYELASYPEYIKAMQQGLAEGALQPLVDEALGERKSDARLRTAYGLLTISVIHQIYTLFGFMGKPTRVINADIWHDGGSINALLEYPNGVRASLDWHMLPHLNDYHEEYAFYGNSDRVIWNLPGPYYRNFPSPVTIQGGDGALSWEKKIKVSYEEAFARELLEFYDNVQAKRQPRSSVHDAVIHSQFINELIAAVR